MKRSVVTILGALGLWTIAAAVPDAAHAGCKKSQLVGDYGFLATGNIIQGTDTQPYAAGGLMTFRDDGTVSLVGTQSVDGVVGPVSPNEAEYVVGADCKGSATIGENRFFEFVIVGNGASQQINFIRSDDDGAVVTGYAKRKATGCSLNNVKGVYGYAFNAIVFNLTLNGMQIDEALFAGGGTVAVNSAGQATLKDTASFGGFVIDRSYTGTVDVDRDCVGSAVVDLPPNAPTTVDIVHVDAVWVNERKSVMLIQTDQGTFIAGEATQLSGAPAPK